MTGIEEPAKVNAAPKMGRSAVSDPTLCEIVIERNNQEPVTKTAKKDWQNRNHSEITEACVRDLGFSTVKENGEKRKSLRLLWRPRKSAKGLEDDFLIVPTGDHEIVLGEYAYDRWFQASNPGVYPCFMRKEPKETRKRREDESKTRHEQEIEAERNKWLANLQKERHSPSSEPAASRL